MKKLERILLKGYYGFGNLGDDILLKTTWNLFSAKFDQSEIVVFSNFNKNLTGFSQVPNYNEYLFKILKSQPKLIDWTHQASFDLVIDGGGGVYFDYKKGGRLRAVFNTILKYIGANGVSRVDLFLRKIFGKKKRTQYNQRIGMGLGIGPYTNSSPDLYYDLTEIGTTDVIFVRDQKSMEWLNSLGFKGQKFCFTDLAFLSALWLPEGFHQDKAKKFERKLGIVLLDWHEGNEARFQQVKEFANWALNAGYFITFFSFDENSDTEYIAAFQPYFDLKIWSPNQILLQDFLKELAGQSIIFSARAHGVILSSILGVPSVTMGTSLKLVEVSKMFPKSTTLVNEPFTHSILQKNLALMESEYKERLVALGEDVANNQRIANDFLGELNHLFN